MLIQNLNSLFGQEPRPIERQELTLPVETEYRCEPQTSGKFDADIKALTEKYGSLTGLCNIEATLQELLTICPRKRPRIDAYQGLKGHLQTEYGVTLTIKSRKTK